jgi:lipoprotein-anchoring transpeptidase ErfK/SrfK
MSLDTRGLGDDGGRARGLRVRRWVAVGGLVVVVAAILVLVAGYVYARGRRSVVADGVRVGRIDLGGLTAAAARAKLARAYRPLARPVVLRYRNGRLVLTPREARLSVGIDAVVRRALAVSRRGWFVPRAWRELTGGQVHAALRPQVRYSPAVVEQAVETLQRRIDRAPVDAVVVPTFNRLTVKSGHGGVAVGARGLHRQIETALTSPSAPRVITVPVRYPRAKVTLATLRRRYPAFITIDRGAFTLRLYRRLTFDRSYPIAVGQTGLQTPAGLYHVQNKVVDPSWHVPFSSWTGSLAGKVIPPGPDDPLKARWLGIFNGAGIHGTDETWSIGHAVSHGCVRMTIPDVIDLYNRVAVGTPIYIGD